MEKRDRLIQDILDREWTMFKRVLSLAPASCQSRPETFRRVRGSIFIYWPDRLLASYLADLTEAEGRGRNLLTEKYARMDGLIPPLNTSPVIDRIVNVETAWQEEIRRRYPALYRRCCRDTARTDDGLNFSVYLQCELETYGDTTLALYDQWVDLGRRRGENYSLTMLDRIARQSGFADLDEAEGFWSDALG